MPAIMRIWFDLSRPRQDLRDGDPYLEGLVRQLARLRDNGAHRHSPRRQG